MRYIFVAPSDTESSGPEGAEVTVSGYGSGGSTSVWCCGQDRNRDAQVVRLPVKRVLSMTLIVGVAALSPAMFLALAHPSTAMLTPYLLVASGLLAVIAGGVGLVSWRMTADALHGWLGSAFVLLGALVLVASGLSGLGVIDRAAEPAGALVNSLVAGLLVWKGIRCEAAASRISPLIALGCGAGLVLSLSALCIGLTDGAAVPAWVSTRVAQSLPYLFAGVIWMTMAVAGLRRLSLHYTALALSLLGSALLVRSAAPASSVLMLASSVLVFSGMSIAFGTALTHLDGVMQNGGQLYRRLRDELDASRRKAEDDRKAQEAWLHDLQGAVAALQAAGAVLQTAPDGWREGRATLADSVTAELAWLQTLVESTRQLSPTDLDLEDILAAIVAGEHLLGTRIDLDVAGIGVFADRVALRRVLQNILVNARHYAPHSAIEISAAAHPHAVEIAIRDYGPGVPPSERPTIFERGTRGTASAGTHGSGLGLYVAQSLIESMCGSIRVEGASPGCRFVITVPPARRHSRVAIDPHAYLGGADHLVGTV